MKLAVHSITGKETSKKVDLSTDVFGVEILCFVIN